MLACFQVDLMALKFSFSKTKQPSLLEPSLAQSLIDQEGSAVKLEDGHEDEKQDVLTFDGSMRKRKAEHPLVIPLIKRNFYNSQDSEDKAAAAELLSEAKTLNDERENRLEEGNGPMSNLIVDMMANRAGARESEEDGSSINVDARPESSNLDDYDRIPVNGFGMAMLRGMGFSKDAGIGRTFKQSIKPVEVNLRPKGLGLGATPMGGSWAAGQVSKDGEDLESSMILDPKVGQLFDVLRGPHKGTRGKMVGFDGDTSRILIKCEKSGSVVSVPIVSIQMANSNSETERKQTKIENGGNHNISDVKNEPDLSNMDVPNGTKSSKKSRNEKNSLELKGDKEPWLLHDLKVRIIDKSICRGRYYKEKVRIVDVVTPFTCDCRTDSGTLLENISQTSLETVIPRLSSSSNQNSAFVKIVRGRKRGRTAEVLSINRDKLRVEVLVIDMDEEPLQLTFDDVCQLDTGSG